MLRDSQVQQFQQEGYLVLPSFANPNELEQLRQGADFWVKKLEKEWDQSIFSTEEQSQNSNQYFLDSANRISVFMEESESDSSHRVNKLGHALHRLDPVFRDFCDQEKFQSLYRDLSFKKALPLQSMYIFKQPRIGGKVVAHQDSSFLYTDPPSVIGFWLAIDPASRENGCLWAIPGGHREALRKRFVCQNGNCDFVDLAPGTLPEEGYVPLEVDPGTLILLHGQLPHKSEANRSAKAREAFTLHVVEGTHPYPKDNWLQIN